MICGNCGGREGRNGEWLPCNQCGFDSEFTGKYEGGYDDFHRWEERVRYFCHTCSKPNDEDELKPARDAWRCNDCGYVGAMHEDAVAADSAYDELLEREG